MSSTRSGFELISLTDTHLDTAQEQEFHTPLLKQFAEAYLAFRYSSPYTAKKAVYPYFEPLKAEELPEGDILYGPDREECYKNLMKLFNACKITGAFDEFFDQPKKTLWWKSNTIKGLVIFKQWLK